MSGTCSSTSNSETASYFRAIGSVAGACSASSARASWRSPWTIVASSRRSVRAARSRGRSSRFSSTPSQRKPVAGRGTRPSTSRCSRGRARAACGRARPPAPAGREEAADAAEPVADVVDVVVGQRRLLRLVLVPAAVLLRLQVVLDHLALVGARLHDPGCSAIRTAPFSISWYAFRFSSWRTSVSRSFSTRRRSRPRPRLSISARSATPPDSPARSAPPGRATRAPRRTALVAMHASASRRAAQRELERVQDQHRLRHPELERALRPPLDAVPVAERAKLSRGRRRSRPSRRARGAPGSRPRPRRAGCRAAQAVASLCAPASARPTSRRRDARGTPAGRSASRTALRHVLGAEVGERPRVDLAAVVGARFLGAQDLQVPVGVVPVRGPVVDVAHLLGGTITSRGGCPSGGTSTSWTAPFQV
jgi:hypothetical protein